MNSEEWYRAHSSARKDVDYKSLSFNSQASNNNLQRSVSADNVVIRSRGFKPSDRHDPAKRNFLESLTSKILHFEMVSLSREEWKKSTRVFCDKQKNAYSLCPAAAVLASSHCVAKIHQAEKILHKTLHPSIDIRWIALMYNNEL